VDRITFLLIDDTPDDRALAMRHLQREFSDASFVQAGSAADFQTQLAHGDFDVAVTDYQLRWSDGIAILKELKARYPKKPVIMFTASGNEEVAVESMKAGLDDYVIKSSKGYVGLAATVRLTLERHAARQSAEQSAAELRRVNDNLEQLVKERTRELDDIRRTLEHRVAERTAELQEKIAELEEFQAAVVGRELKMIELEKQVKELRAAGKPTSEP
jgi:DNA-binding NtrC family response regulator